MSEHDEEFEVVSLEEWREQQFADEEELDEESTSDWTRDPQ